MQSTEISIETLLDKDSGEMDSQPCFLTVEDLSLYFAINYKMPNANDGIGSFCYIASYDLSSMSVKWLLKIDAGENKSFVSSNFLIHGEILLVVATYELTAIEKITGKIIWSTKFKKPAEAYLSSIDDKVFFSNWGELSEINPKNGKKIKTVKPRVKWFCSSIVAMGSRYFVGTSDSKVLEFDDMLEKVREFKYPGGWAIGCEPIIYDNKLISSSYGSKTIIFDLVTNEPIKRLNKNVGSRPNHLLVGDFYLLHESVNCNQLSCYDLLKNKKVWNISYPGLQGVWCKDSENVFVVFDDSGDYVVGIVDLNKGDLVSIIDRSSGNLPISYKFGLWSGISINSSLPDTVVMNYIPSVIKLVREQ